MNTLSHESIGMLFIIFYRGLVLDFFLRIYFFFVDTTNIRTFQLVSRLYSELMTNDRN